MVEAKKSDLMTKVLVIVGAVAVVLIGYLIWHALHDLDLDSFAIRDAGN